MRRDRGGGASGGDGRTGGRRYAVHLLAEARDASVAPTDARFADAGISDAWNATHQREPLDAGAGVDDSVLLPSERQLGGCPPWRLRVQEGTFRYPGEPRGAGAGEALRGTTGKLAGGGRVSDK